MPRARTCFGRWSYGTRSCSRMCGQVAASGVKAAPVSAVITGKKRRACSDWPVVVQV